MGTFSVIRQVCAETPTQTSSISLLQQKRLLKLIETMKKHLNQYFQSAEKEVNLIYKSIWVI